MDLGFIPLKDGWMDRFDGQIGWMNFGFILWKGGWKDGWID